MPPLTSHARKNARDSLACSKECQLKQHALGRHNPKSLPRLEMLRARLPRNMLSMCDQQVPRTMLSVCDQQVPRTMLSTRDQQVPRNLC